jgi:hypothetical protein
LKNRLFEAKFTYNSLICRILRCSVVDIIKILQVSRHLTRIKLNESYFSYTNDKNNQLCVAISKKQQVQERILFSGANYGAPKCFVSAGASFGAMILQHPQSSRSLFSDTNNIKERMY